MAGVSNPYLSQIERGLRKPSAEILQQIARALEISSETLYVRAGILEERPEDADLVGEIRRDPWIDEEQKRTLIQIYESFRAASTAAEAAQAAVGVALRAEADLEEADPDASGDDDDGDRPTTRNRSGPPGVERPRGPGLAPQPAHLAPRPAGHGRQRGHERLRARAGRGPGPRRPRVHRLRPQRPPGPGSPGCGWSPGVTVAHVPAGPPALAKEDLPAVVDGWADGRGRRHRADGGTDVLHSNYWLSGVAGHRLKHELDRPLVSTFHTLARVKAAAGDPEPESRARAEAAVMACSDAVLASCPAEARQLVELYGVPRQRISLVAPGVEGALFSPGPRVAARRAVADLDLGERPMLLLVGRIQHLKGIDVAVRALAAMRARDAVLVVCGGPSGARRRRLPRRGRGPGGRPRAWPVGCRVVAPRPHHELSSLYRAADVVVVPSRSESFGLVALEAAACGRPVVASAVGGLSTLVDHRRTGLLLAGRDPERWAAALDGLLATPLRRAARWARAAARAALRYRWSRAADDLAASTPRSPAAPRSTARPEPGPSRPGGTSIRTAGAS